MRQFLLKDLHPITGGHILQQVLPGKYLYAGGLEFMKPGERAHTDDGPDGRDYHVHEDCEAFVVIQGKGRMEIEKSFLPLAPGDIFIVEPGEDHHVNSDETDPLIILWCHAGPNRNKK